MRMVMGQNNVKNRVPILVPLLISLVVLVVVAIVCVQWSYRKHCEKEVATKIDSLDALFKEHIGEDVKLMTSVIELVEDNEKLQAAWQAQDRGELLNNALPILNKIKARHSITHFYFHTWYSV